MKFCSNCGEKLTEGAMFCSNCGTAVNGNQLKEVNQENKQYDAGQSHVNQPKVDVKDTFHDVKDAIQTNGYFNFIKKSLTNPSTIQTFDNSYYGWIHFGFLAILFTISLYFLLRGMILWSMTDSYMMRQEFGAADMGLRIIQEVLLPRLSIVSFITFLTYPLAAFITLKFFTNIKQSFNQLLNQMAGLFTVNIVILLLSVFISLIFKTPGTLTFSMILILLVVPLTIIAYNYYIFNNIHESKIDNYYIILTGNLLLIFFSFIIGFLHMDAVTSFIQEIEYYL